jgi:acyl carrier protein
MTSTTQSDIEDKVTAIVCEQLDVKRDDVSRDKTFTDDLGADSLAIVELVLAFEEAFGLKIPDAEVDSIKTVGNAIDYIKKNAGRAS